MFHLLQTYVAFKCFMLQVFRVLEVYSESHGGTARAPGEGGVASQGLSDGVRGAPRVLRTERTYPHQGSRVPPARREKGSGGRVVGAVKVRVRGGMRQTHVRMQQ